MTDTIRELGGFYVKVCLAGLFVCYACVTINDVTLLSQRGPSLDGKLPAHTTWSGRGDGVPVKGFKQRKTRADLVAVGSRGWRAWGW